MEQSHDVRRTLNLDAKTDRLLQRLASSHDGNLSMTARYVIREAAERRGLTSPQDTGRLKNERPAL